MKQVSMTELIQSAYSRAKRKAEAGDLPISNIQDLCHVAHTFALLDLYGETKKLNYKKHYSNSIDRLYKLFDKGTLSVEQSYLSFAYCYLKVLEAEGVIKQKTFLAQIEFEKSNCSLSPSTKITSINA